MSEIIHVREATKNDFEALYALGNATKEFKVSATGEFMERDEFLSAIEGAGSTFLLAAVNDQIVGFVYANRQDIERGEKTQWACLVYLVVAPDMRGMGIAAQLYAACIAELKKHGINKVYGWANTEGDGSIVAFMKKQGFAEGHKYLWMDKEI